jgi:Peptidase A4 family
MHKPKKKWRTNAIFLVVLWIVLLLSSVTVLSSVVTPFLRSLQTQTLISLDWAGYAVSTNNLFPQPQVVGVNASWIVPAVTTSGFDAFSAAWIGVGGQTDSTLIQIGSEHDSISGQPVYALWYELLPANSIPIENITVSPGDQINAAVTLIESSTNTWRMEISDVTTGQSFTKDTVYNSSRLTAEWIMERPTVNNQMSTLAHFGSITFTNLSAKISNKVGTANDFSNYEILMEDRQNNQLVKVSNLNKEGTSFTVNYS